MAGNKMVVDTSIFIDYLRAKNKTKTELYLIPDNSTLYVSAVTIYELYMGATNDEKRDDIRLLTDGLIILPFTKETAIISSKIFHQLKKVNKLIEFRDIFIAATAKSNNMSVKTLNKKHFSIINDIEID